MTNKNIEDINPLIPVQQGMLYETLQAPASGIHIEQSMYTLRGALEITAFERAWQWAIDRHSILRTGFVWKEQAEPLQVTLRQVRMTLASQDLRGLSLEEQRVHIQDYFRQERARGFKLSRPPLMRLALLQIDDQTTCLMWTFHHMIMDGWSVQILLGEIVAYYMARSQGQTFHLKPSRPYSDYIRWLKAQDVSQAEQFWRNTLHGFTKPTALGREIQGSSTEPSPERYGTVSAHLLPAMETTALHMLARRHRITLSTIIQGVWAILLSRYSGTEDVVFGITVSGRSATLPDIETMVGLYMNTLPLRVWLPGSLSLWPWFEALQRFNTELSAFEYSSAGQIYQWSDMSGTSLLYESVLVVENYPAISSTPGNVGISVVDTTSQGAQTKYMVTLMVAGETELEIKCVYDTSRWEQTAIQRVLEHFQLILDAVASGRDVQLATLSSLIPIDHIPVVHLPQALAQTKTDDTLLYSPIEEMVASVWREVLGEHNQLDRASNFFEFGGHSLLATQMTSRLRVMLGIELPLRAVFEAPTIAGFARQVEQTLRRDEGMALPPLVAGARPETLPLSFAQQRLWFLDQLEPDSTVYLEPGVLHLSGEINTQALEHSMQELLQRHESLRTTFVDRGAGEPVQVIHPGGHFSLPIIDLQALEPPLQEEVVRNLASQEAQKPCSLSRGPLLRSMLLRQRPDEHVLLLTLHHIITDGWSGEIMLRELRTLYHAYTTGQSSPLAPLTVQYADYALWQRRWLQGEVLEVQLGYWRKQLAEVSPLALPTDHPRPAVQTSRGAQQRWLLPPTLVEAVRALSQQQHVTLFMTLLTSFQVLLMRYSGQSDISVGTPIANRRQPEIEGVIGFFVNTLVMRTDLSGNPSFVEALQRVREVCLEAYTHQDLPFEQVVEALAPERDPSRSPLFQVMFILQNTPHHRHEVAGLEIHQFDFELTESKFDLTLSVAENEQGLSALLEYNTDLFEAQMIQRLLGHWQTLLEGVVDCPQTRLSALPLLSAAEHVQILERWTDTQTDEPRPLGIHLAFELQVQRTPDAIAVVFEELQITYAELQQHSNHLAVELQAHGVGLETVVAVCLPRTPMLVASLLAILKAGGAYLPLDPDSPQERFAFLLQDAQVKLLLTQTALRQRLPQALPPVLYLDHALPPLTGKELAPWIAVPHQLAYVIYTSGSTGRPKGVMATHQATLNRVSWMEQRYPYLPGEVACQKTNLSFVDAVSEIFGPLLQGIPLVMLAEEVVIDPVPFLTHLQQYAVTRIVLVPSLLQAFLATNQELLGRLEHLRTWICSGETLPLYLAQQLHYALPHARLLNFYGASEVAADVTSYEVDTSRWHSPVAIGRPIANTQIYLLDAEGQPVPVGIPGEIFVGGENLARGYLGHPDRTAERFLPHPFAHTPGSRLYQTGDRARYLPDGTIEFLGRVDQQVKIRGIRIELGEIESVLQAHPAVHACVVLAREDRPGDLKLVGYIVAHPGSTVISSDLRSALQAQLPSALLPSIFIFLDTLPLTASGKVDRRALPAPETILDTERHEAERSRTPLEELLVGLWEKSLGRRSVGLHDNFFEIGGHSLLATHLIGQARKLLAVEIPLRILFDAPTVSTFAQRVEQLLHQRQERILPPLVARERPAVLPLSFAQQRLWFLDQLEPGSVAYLLSSAIMLEGTIETKYLEQAVQQVIDRHESLRTTFSERDGQAIQIIQQAPALPLPVIDLQGLQPELRDVESKRLTRAEANHPCNLAQGPLLRTTLVRLAPDQQLLLLTLHHIITDGWSMNVLVRELTILYQAAVAEQPSPLAPLAIQYADYALWQRDWLQGEVLERQLDYWREHLSELAPLELPTDHPRPEVLTSRGASQVWQMPLELSEGLYMLSRQEHVTLFMLLLASFQVLLMRYSGQSDISVGTPIANRQHAETEDVIGFFVNTLVLRTDLSGNPSFCELLHQVREVCLGAYAHQDLPFEQVVEALAPERTFNRSPLFQVLLVLQKASHEQRDLTGVRLTPLATEQTISRFDLTLAIAETEQGLHSHLTYRTDLFEQETITQLLAHWQTLLAGIVHDPHVPLNFLPLLSASEHAHIRAYGEGVCYNYPLLLVHQLFEQQVRLVPDAIALVFEQERLTYAELNRHANQLARHLQSLGAGPDVLIGISIQRSPAMIIAMLAVLKAGSAYVPLDPDLPAPRLATIINDAQPLLLLTHDQQQEKHLSSFSGSVFCFERDGSRLEPYQQEDLLLPISPSNLAYLLFTSGSTGQPKGVQVEHRQVLNYTRAIMHDAHLENDHSFALLQPLAFDSSISVLFPALCSGGCLHLITRERSLDPYAMQTYFTCHPIDCLKITPSHLAALHATAHPEKSMPLNHLLLGGEAFSWEWIQTLAQRSPSCTIINHYGPTEATVGSLIYQIAPLTKPGAMYSTPLEKPLANLQAYVLDADLQLLPLGAIGELYIGGSGVTRGYHGRPEQTASVFLPHPFSTEPGARLYRTGDLMRRHPNGLLEYLGRLDQQVKINGYRIELQEIEALLETYPTIQECVVLVREDLPGQKRLVAYLVGRPGEELNIYQIRTYIQERLPAPMIPAAFLRLDRFPLTPHGKLHRQALPAPDWEQQYATEISNPMIPLSPLEQIVAGVWRKILALDHVSRESNFFMLGGHSLLATQVIGRLRQVLAIEIPLKVLFEASTVAGLAHWVEQAQQRGEGISRPPLEVKERPAILPLSFAQQRLWFLDQLEPDSAAYLIPHAWLLQGVLDLPSLQKSFQTLLNRQESLRTTFHEHNGHVVQHIHLPSGLISLPVLDLQGLSGEQRELTQYHLMHQEAHHPCDLAHGPLMRATLLRLGHESHVLLLTVHHIIADGWSMQVLIRELTTLYQATVAEQASPLPPLPVQYADYALWQRDWLQGTVLKTQLDYWRTQLIGVAPLALPTDHPRPSVQSYRGASRSWYLSEELAEGLHTLSQQEQVTLFMTLLASFQILLMRYSGQTDISVGTPIANRQHAETEDVIGFFVNTLVMRTDLSGNPSFVDLLHRVREVCLGAYTHQDIPFEQVVEALAPERDLGRSPLFQVLFILQNTLQTQPEDSELHVHPFALERTISKFDLTLSITEQPQGLHVSMEYNTDLFEAQTIQRMFSHWENLLKSVLHDPRARLSVLSMLTSIEQAHLLEGYNNTPVDAPLECSIHQRFEQQVQHAPDAIALIFAEHALTYEELNRRANQVGHHLQRRGVGPEVLVGICMDRSLEVVIGLLAVLKAGGAYVPLDPSYPAERLALMISDSGLRFVLTQRHLTSVLVYADGVTAISLDEPEEGITAEASETTTTAMTSTHLAYVIYTSGSTGQPKGVMVPHRSVLSFMNAMDQHLLDTESASPGTWLAVTSISFDISVLELLWTLTRGLMVVIQAEAVDQSIAAQLQRYGITYLQCTPSLAQYLVSDASSREALSSLKHFLVGGEALPQALAAQLVEIVSGQVSNMYGPTETTIWSTMALLQRTSQQKAVTIGYPLDNTQIYVLDPDLQCVPIGVVGELYIGGTGVVRGYWHHPLQTSERFVPHPFAREAGTRLYRTGDLARLLQNGEIVFVGRVDQQVKIRGHRIELGEIEAVLATHPSVRECVVLAREDRPGDQRLVAYLIAQPDTTLKHQDLRNTLQKRLPSWMLPSTFVSLECFPLTPNGKVDRRAFPKPEAIQLMEERLIPQNSQYLEARPPIEELLLGIWSQVLDRSHLEIDDNFFEAGGHSLLATQIIARLRQAFHLDVPVRSLFQAPTIRGLAEEIERLQRGHLLLSLPPLAPGDRSLPLPLSFAQERFWLLEQLDRKSGIFMPAALRLHGVVRVAEFQQSLEAVVQRHEILRTTFTNERGQLSQVIAPAGSIPLPVINLEALSTESREIILTQLIHQEFQHPFDLVHGPLLRATLLRISEQDYVLLLTMHHILSDGWSQGILVRDLSALYRSCITGETASLPELPIQYADYALWQRQWFQGAVLQAQLDYWRQQLLHMPELMELPLDHPRPALQSYAGRQISWQAPSELAKQLKQLSQREHVTLFMTLLASWQILLMRYSGQHDFATGTFIANRTRPELENLIGVFVNTLVLRADLTGHPSFLQLLERVRTMTLDAYTHQDIPFEKLLESLPIERSLSHAALFQVLFTFQNYPESSLDLPELSWQPLGANTQNARFDLAVEARERSGALIVSFEYNTDLFEASTIQRLITHWQVLLEAIVAHPEGAIDLFPLMTPQETQALLVQSRATNPQRPPENCLHELFEQWANLSPDAIAVVHEHIALTYAHVNTRANQLAHYLRRLGVGPDTFIGVAMERCPDLIVALLAVLKAGGAYVPLDPSSPSERLALMLKETDLLLVITQATYSETIAAHATQSLCMDTMSERWSGEPLTNPATWARPEHLAYMIYTSGSTGIPKGVMIPHANVVRLLTQTQHWFDFTPQDTWTFFHSYAFDFSIWEIWGSLLTGGRLIIVPYLVSREPDAFYHLLCRQAVTILNQTPSAFQQLIQAEAQETSSHPLALRTIIFGGEALEFQRLAPWIARHGDHSPRLINMYGITETTVHVTYRAITQQDVVEQHGSMIGKAIPDLSCYVLDEQRHVVPTGVAGELFVGGPGLARGYWQQPQITAERFIPHPFSRIPGERLYRTGDRVRILASGELAYLGRTDQQIKLRGFRIELGEIAAVLEQMAEVREALVLLREDRPEQKHLVAYVIPQQSQGALTIHDLQTQVRTYLPEYMVPTYVIFMETWPLTLNGKINEKALPVPTAQHLSQRTAYLAPQTPLQEELALLWADLLQIARVGIHDHFFEVGGNSLLAVQLLNQMHHRLGTSLSFVSLFQAPTIEQQATLLQEHLQSSHSWTPLVTIQQTGQKSPFFCMHPVVGTVYSYVRLAQSLRPDRPFYGLQARGFYHDQVPYATVEEMASAYVTTIRTVQPQGPYFLGGHSSGGLVAYEMARQLQEQGEKIALLALLDSVPWQEQTMEQALHTPALPENRAHARTVIEYLTLFNGYRDQPLALTYEQICDLSPEEQLQTVLDRLKAANQLAQSMSTEEFMRFMQVLITNLTSYQRYRPGRYQGPITLLQCAETSTDAQSAWAPFISQPLEVHTVPGTHFSMLTEAHVVRLAAQLQRCIDKAETTSIVSQTEKKR